MELEWNKMWKRVWHVGGRTAQLEEAGDYIVHNFRHESVVMIRQHDGGIRAFFNVCQHRGNRLFWNSSGAMADGLRGRVPEWPGNAGAALPRGAQRLP